MSDTEDIQITEEDIREFDPEEKFEFREAPVQPDTDYSNIVIIDGLPIEPEAKAEKLAIFVKKVITKMTKIENFQNFSLPIGRDKKTKGFCFVELANAEQAKMVQQHVNGFDPIRDGKLVFKVYTLSEIDRIEKASTEQPEQKPAAPKTLQERENFRTWLQDEKARDQYAIRHFDMVEVFWNDSINKAVSVQSKKNWSEDRIAWSPFGSYLITFHIQGIALWGGDTWKNIAKFAHKKPVFLDFSPNERFIVIANEDSTNNVMIAEVKTQRKLKFTIPVQELKRNWPNFKWSADEKYFSELHAGKGLVLYNSSDFSKKTLPIDGIQNYSWSPTDGPSFMYWIPDSAPLPGKVALMNAENGKEIRFKNSFNITNVSIYWNKSGEYVAAQIERTSKSKEKKIESQFEIFRLKEKNIPIDTIEIKETVVNFAWEPFGHKFGIIHTNDPNKKKVSFYGLAKGNFKLIKTIPDKSVDMFFFSPKGRFVILANTNSDKGVIEFWDINEEPEMVGQGEHYMMSDLEWDPSGRYVTTYVSAYTRYSDYGYTIWTFLGKIHHKYTADKFWQFLWRPRPPTLLTAKDEKEIQKSFAEKKKQYLKEEKDAFENSKEQQLQVRKQLWQDFLDLQARWKAEYEQERAARSKLLGFDGERERDYKVEMVEVEEVISRKEEEVSE